MEEVPLRASLAPLRPLVSYFVLKGGNGRASVGGWGSLPLCGGTFARHIRCRSESAPRPSGVKFA